MEVYTSKRERQVIPSCSSYTIKTSISAKCPTEEVGTETALAPEFNMIEEIRSGPCVGQIGAIFFFFFVMPHYGAGFMGLPDSKNAAGSYRMYTQNKGYNIPKR